MIELPTHTATRYVQPLREGGSLPAVVDTENGLFVTKFRGAGQGPRALVAELVVGLLARELGFPVPDLALIEILPVFGRAEPDPEIQDLLRASHGINVGLRYLDGAFNYDALAAGSFMDSDLASELVWFDAFVTNPDRTHRNPNLMICNRTPWLIDHGAALYAHHSWASVDDARTHSPFPLIKDHVLLTQAEEIETADARLTPRITRALVEEVLHAVPDSLLLDDRSLYIDYLLKRVSGPRDFVAEALRARAARMKAPPGRQAARR
jgi:hypothetical protein